jgi:hypothetical protein
MLNMSPQSSHIYSEIPDLESASDTAGDQDAHLKAPDERERRKSLVSLATPIIDSLKLNIERRKSEISLHLPSIPVLFQRRKSEASLPKLPIPVITVTGNDGDSENPVEEECIREEIQERGRHIVEGDVIDIPCDEVFEEDFGEGRDESEEVGKECLGYLNIFINILRKCIMKPWESWKEAKFLPREEDISRMIMTGETPDKFSRIDIESRKYFPIAFCILISSYWVAYMYYITDEFPIRDSKYQQ